MCKVLFFRISKQINMMVTFSDNFKNQWCVRMLPDADPNTGFWAMWPKWSTQNNRRVMCKNPDIVTDISDSLTEMNKNFYTGKTPTNITTTRHQLRILCSMPGRSENKWLRINCPDSMWHFQTVNHGVVWPVPLEIGRTWFGTVRHISCHVC